jgi:light-regulated signal transduction histidine kinase (bacteriophytochrome)
MPFQRLHGNNEYKGTGIGSAICKKIIERHSGNITAISKPGCGSTFNMTFPQTGNDI